MTVYYYSGFDITEHYPGFELEIDDGTVSFTVTDADFATKLLSQQTMGGVLSGWDEMDSVLTSAINDAASAAGSFDFFSAFFNTNNLRYTISTNGSTLTLTFNGGGASVGAASSVYSGSTFYTLENVPEHVIVSTIPGRSQSTDVTEPDDVASLAIADAGGTNVQGIARTSAIEYQDWRQEFESKAACFSRAAATDTPWTFQDMIQHCRTVWPLRIVDDSANEDFVARLRKEGASWSRSVIERAAADYDKHWHVNMHVYVVGRP